eukprot:TRINITY_DN6377_c0_g4_i1.p1 TRINITY_DN6377_c0_g4~~TRINITY_DN6377_c0_g4_i1.p1  ORF type:complete len:386 (+),score=93.17 TRINITY_DN6377_c0_g4_i1:62-1159(+)
MDDKYFEEILNEGNEPFSDFISRLNPSLFSPFHRNEAPSESNNSLDIESPKAELIPLSLENEQNNEELKECLFMDIRNDNLKEKSSNMARNKRKCVTELKGEAYSEGMLLTKAEKNKIYAKESRERKKIYIESLEQQVKHLKQKVEIYKARLKDYETIEKFKNTLGYEFYEALNKAYTYMREANQPLTNEPLFKVNFCKALNQVLEEQTNALKTIGKMVVDVALPTHIRVLLWMTEKNIDRMEASEMVKTLHPILTLEQAQAVVKFRNTIDPEGVNYKELDNMIKESSKEIKKPLRQIIACFKDILEKHKAVIEFYYRIDFLRYNPYFMDRLQLIARPEVRESELNTLLTNLSLAENAKAKIKKQ